MYCLNPKETMHFMYAPDEPRIAFQVFAAGSIPPEERFKYAFEYGADFLCVGMYDFQVVDDVSIVGDTLNQIQRYRPWRA